MAQPPPISPQKTSHRKQVIILLAISWGGKLAAALQRRHPRLVNGLILLCPGFYGRQRPPFIQRMAILFSRLFRPTRLFARIVGGRAVIATPVQTKDGDVASRGSTPESSKPRAMEVTV